MKNKKVAFIGNLCNCTYWYVKHLREVGIDAYLYIEFKKYDKNRQPILPFKADPREEDLSLGASLPSWIKFYHLYSLKNFLKINKEFGQYNLNIAFTRLPILLQFCKRPLIIFATGSEMRNWIFKWGFKPILFKRALKKSQMVLFDNIDMDTLKTLDRLNIKKYEWIPDYISKDYLLDQVKKSRLANDFLKNFKEKLVCFSPSRLSFSIKGTDILLKSFANFIDKNKNLARLLIVDWGENNQKTKDLIKKLKIQKNVTLLPRMCKGDVIKIMQGSSVIFGYFKNNETGVHHFPIVIMDALALGKVVISSIDEKAFQKIVGEAPPLLRTYNENDIVTQLRYVLSNYNQVQKESEINGPNWIKKYHSKEFIREKFIRIINKYI